MSHRHASHTPLVLGGHEPPAAAPDADAPIVQSPFDLHRARDIADTPPSSAADDPELEAELRATSDIARSL